MLAFDFDLGTAFGPDPGHILDYVPVPLSTLVPLRVPVLDNTLELNKKWNCNREREQKLDKDEIKDKERYLSMSGIRTKNATDRRIENGARIRNKTKTGTEIENETRIENERGIKCVTGIGIDESKSAEQRLPGQKRTVSSSRLKLRPGKQCSA
ncbi:hypothetical protein EVAR_34270_1 [Eumeta japonica]|uniref:Uncharacterized protein n=1 Tax=Eumeta variegata TaxID=151549 RepID=A0A4C1VZK2_EUMVA|nr:hypothetical protein EVAR_34270_1 [Eumeta japonica]